MVPNKKITIDDLAIMVQHGFNGMDERFDGVEKRLDNVEGRLGRVEGRLGRVEKQLDILEEDVDVLKEDIKYLKQGQERIESNMVYRLEFEKLDDRVAVLENKGKAKIKK
jgi:archaellum component FlaC